MHQNISRRTAIMGAAACVAASATGAHARKDMRRTARLEIRRSFKPLGDPGMGLARLFAVGAEAARLAYASGDLAYLPWQSVSDGLLSVTVPLPGIANGRPDKMWAEIKYPGGATEITQSVSASQPPPPIGFPSEAANVNGSGFTVDFRFQQHAHQFCTYHDGAGGLTNTFVPLLWHPDGYAFNTHHTRGIDVGESPDSVLAMHNYAHWVSPSANYLNLDDQWWTLDLAGGPDFDLKGGQAYCFVLIADVVNGRQLPSSGRHWLMSKPLEIGTLSNFARNHFGIPSSQHGPPGWLRTYTRGGADPSANPQIPYCEGWGIGFAGWSEPPAGLFAIRRFRVGNNSP